VGRIVGKTDKIFMKCYYRCIFGPESPFNFLCNSSIPGFQTSRSRRDRWREYDWM